MEEPIKVKILDHEYLVKSEEDEDHVQKIAQFVNDKLLEIRKHAAGLPENKTAMLAAFHIASDYFQLLRERDQQIRDIQRRAQTLIYQIDSLLG